MEPVHLGNNLALKEGSITVFRACPWTLRPQGLTWFWEKDRHHWSLPEPHPRVLDPLTPLRFWGKGPPPSWPVLRA